MDKSQQMALDLDVEPEVLGSQYIDTSSIKDACIYVEVNKNGLKSESNLNLPSEHSDIRVSVDNGVITSSINARSQPPASVPSRKIQPEEQLERFEFHGETWDLDQCKSFAHDLLYCSIRDLKKNPSSIDFQSAAEWLYGKTKCAYSPQYIADCLGFDLDSLLNGSFSLLDSEQKEYIRNLAK